jgi:hypothetical protein
VSCKSASREKLEILKTRASLFALLLPASASANEVDIASKARGGDAQAEVSTRSFGPRAPHANNRSERMKGHYAMEHRRIWTFTMRYGASVFLLLAAPGCTRGVEPDLASSTSESLLSTVLMKPTGGLGHTDMSTVGCPSDAEWECVTDGTSFAANDGDKTYLHSVAAGGRHGESYSGAAAGTVSQVTTNVVAAAESGASGTVTVSLYDDSRLIATGAAHTLTTTYAAYSDSFNVSVASATSLQTWVTLSSANLKYTEIWIAATLRPLSEAGAGDSGDASHSVTLSWTASTTPGVTYNLFRGTISGGPYTQIQTGITSTSATDTTVIAGNTYYYVAQSQDSNGQSVNSNQVQAVTP